MTLVAVMTMQTSKDIRGNNPFIEDSDEDIDENSIQNAQVTKRSQATEENWRRVNSEKLRTEENDLQSINHQRLLSKQIQTEEKSLQSTDRSKALLFETEQAAIATAKNLMKQREHLERTETLLDTTQNNLKTSKRHIKCIKSITRSVINSFRKKSNPKSLSSNEKKDKGSNNPTGLKRIVEEGSIFSSNSSQNTAIRAREESRQKPLSVSEQMDENIEEMIPCVSRLKELALGLSGELDSQNNLIDRMQISADKADWQVRRQTKDTEKINKM